MSTASDNKDVPKINPEPAVRRFPIVGIGASAGGLEAIIELLSNSAVDGGVAFLIVQHLQPNHPSMLAEILANNTDMPVTEATEGEAIRPNRIYVIPPNTSMTVTRDRLVLRPRHDTSGGPMPVDDLFESLAAQGSNAIGVILSGSGTDGALGMQAIKDEGGITFAQDDESAGFTGMPHAAVGLGCVDFVLPPRLIARQLARIGRHPYLAPVPAEPIDEPMRFDEEGLQPVFRLLRSTCNIDFTHYKRGTVTRRLARRLALHHIESLVDYIALLETNPEETHALCQDLLIRVTSFFRDPATFNGLTKTVFPRLLQARSPSKPIRIWVPGCATGEEVYSIAMALVDYLGERAAHTPIQIFGTDINAGAIETARTGRYIENIARNVSEERLRRFFVKVDTHYQIAKSIRDLCVFACQDLTHDPPFSHVDMVSCQNLLIYLDSTLQKRVIPIFHYALNPHGILVLGRSETIGAFSGLFSPLDIKNSKVYAKVPVQQRAQLELMEEHLARRGAREPKPAAATPAQRQADPILSEADRIALLRFVPAGVLCDEELNVLQFRGDTGPFLAHASGPPSLNLRKLARPELLVQIVSAVQQARSGAAVRTAGIRMEVAGEVREITLEVVSLPQTTTQDRSFLIFFQQTSRPAALTLTASLRAWLRPMHRLAPAREADSDVGRLTRELEASRDYIRVITEQHESANEELKSAQEELLSSNEEFQSTNEELETAKEELQSSNEELSTTNDELRHRNCELSALNQELVQARDYADAIVETVREPLLVLSENLRVVRANRAFYTFFKTTPAATERGLIYELGDRQWSIPALRRLLEEILPQRAESFDYEVTHSFPHIGEKTLHFNARRLAWGERTLILLAIDDMTERQAVLGAIRAGERRKDEFLAMLGHELRNPLAAIRNALEIWRRGDAGAAAEQQAQAMLDRQLCKEARLVDDLLDVSRITHGTITLNTDTIDLVQVITEAVEETRPLLDARGHALELTLPAEPVPVAGDAIRLEQVVANLLSNSIKFTEPGGRIHLTLAREGKLAVLKLLDNGVGIAPQLLPAIFDLFVQAERSLDRRQAGLGLGLTLVRRLVELHGGTVEAKSQGLKQGSEFIVRLPLSSSGLPTHGTHTRTTPVSMAPVSRRILVVEDNTDTAASLAMLLRLDRHEVEIAHDGPAAIEAAQRFKPQVVLLDIGLPHLNGYEVARRLRELPDTEHALLIALSGYGRSEDRQRSMQAGFDDHLVKPAHPDQINILIANR